MKNVLYTAGFILAASQANAVTVYYPEAYCAEIVSSEYSTAGGDSSFQLYEIMCKDKEGKYTTFITSWVSASSFFGLGRAFHETRIDLVPYDGQELTTE